MLVSTAAEASLLNLLFPSLYKLKHFSRSSEQSALPKPNRKSVELNHRFMNVYRLKSLQNNILKRYVIESQTWHSICLYLHLEHSWWVWRDSWWSWGHEREDWLPGKCLLYWRDVTASAGTGAADGGTAASYQSAATKPPRCCQGKWKQVF